MGGPHEWRTGADRGVGEPRAVGRRAEADLLTQVAGHGKRRPAGRVGQLLDRGDESVTASVRGPHDPLVAPAVTDSLAELFHAGRQRRLRHELMPPYDFQQLGLGDHTVAVLDQVGEDIEHLWLDVHQLAAGRQLVTRGVQHTAFEPVSHRQIVPLAVVRSRTVSTRENRPINVASRRSRRSSPPHGAVRSGRQLRVLPASTKSHRG